MRKQAILADATCVKCGHRIGWHDQFYGCPGFSVDSGTDLRALLDAWWLENEPPSGFRSDLDVPSFVRTARASLAMASDG